LYELLHGKSPYHNINQHQKLEKMRKREPIPFNSKISNECQSLIRALLEYDDKQRPNIEYIFNHPWMLMYEKEFGLNFLKIRNNQMKSNNSAIKMKYGKPQKDMARDSIEFERQMLREKIDTLEKKGVSKTNRHFEEKKTVLGGHGKME